MTLEFPSPRSDSCVYSRRVNSSMLNADVATKVSEKGDAPRR